MSKQEFSVPEIANSYKRAKEKSTFQMIVEAFVNGKITQAEYGIYIRQEVQENIDELYKNHLKLS